MMTSKSPLPCHAATKHTRTHTTHTQFESMIRIKLFHSVLINSVFPACNLTDHGSANRMWKKVSRCACRGMFGKIPFSFVSGQCETRDDFGRRNFHLIARRNNCAEFYVFISFTILLPRDIPPLARFRLQQAIKCHTWDAARNLCCRGTAFVRCLFAIRFDRYDRCTALRNMMSPTFAGRKRAFMSRACDSHGQANKTISFAGQWQTRRTALRWCSMQSSKSDSAKVLEDAWGIRHSIYQSQADIQRWSTYCHSLCDDSVCNLHRAFTVFYCLFASI